MRLCLPHQPVKKNRHVRTRKRPNAVYTRAHSLLTHNELTHVLRERPLAHSLGGLVAPLCVDQLQSGGVGPYFLHQ